MDLFGEEFKLKIKGRKYKQSTGFGKILTFFIFGLSLGYFLYLMYEYVSGNLLPRKTVSMIQKQENEIKFQSEFVQFGVIINPFKTAMMSGLTEEQLNDIFINQPLSMFRGRPLQGDMETLKMTFFDTFFCPKNQFSKNYKYELLCIDDTQDIIISQNNLGVTKPLSLQMGRCQMFESDPTKCQSFEFQNLLLSEVDFMFNLDFISKSFDTDTEQFSESLTRHSIFGDTELMHYVQIIINKTTVKYDKGILFSSFEEVSYVSGYDIKQTTVSNIQAFQKWGQMTGMTQKGDMLAFIDISVNLKEELIIVEYVKFSEVIAMFLGIFNILFALGALAKIFSEAVIDEEIMQNQLQNQYKQTLHDIETNYGKEQQFTLKSKGGIQTIKNLFLTVTRQKKKKESRTAAQVYPNSQEMFKDKELVRQSVYTSLKQKVEEQTNIIYMQNEIARLKTTIQLLLTPEQYFAISSCGKRLPELIQQEEKNLNHLEIIEKYENNIKYQEKIINQYVKKLSMVPYDQLSEIDQKLLNCHVKGLKLMPMISKEQLGLQLFDELDEIQSQNNQNEYADIENDGPTSQPLNENKKNELNTTNNKDNIKGIINNLEQSHIDINSQRGSSINEQKQIQSQNDIPQNFKTEKQNRIKKKDI